MLKLARLAYDGRHHVGEALARTLIESAKEASVGSHHSEPYQLQVKYTCADIELLRSRVNNLSWTSSASFKTVKLDITKHVAGDSICDSDCLTVHSHPHIHLDSHDHHPDAAACSLPKESNLAEDMPLSFAARRPLLRSFSVGLIHGLAGSAAIALLALAAIPQPLWETLYLTIVSVLLSVWG
jgi:hypothetical protein